jgi:hypothetical protein
MWLFIEPLAIEKRMCPPPAPRPGLQVDRAQVAHIERRDDLETLGLDKSGVGRFLLGREFLRQFLGNDGILGHAMLLAAF